MLDVCVSATPPVLTAANDLSHRLTAFLLPESDRNNRQAHVVDGHRYLVGNAECTRALASR